MASSLPRQKTAEQARALAAFGLTDGGTGLSAKYREVLSGKNGSTIFTIGYERRDGEALISELVEADIGVLVDVRDRPVSRRPDFRKASLERLCAEAGIDYECWSDLGSTGHQRDQLRETGDLAEFRRRFRDHASRRRSQVLDRLAKRTRGKSVALLCYERCHEECHRSIVADLLASRTQASIVAIL